jgi:hypothetical protein
MPATAIPQPKPAPSRLRGETAAGSARAQKIRNFFTEEDDKLLTEYVKQRCGASRKWSGNEMYKDFEEHVGITPFTILKQCLTAAAPATHLALMARPMAQSSLAEGKPGRDSVGE